ncbi:hypothetical protein JAAARDRAFT_40925 [Jaapia argillacea MUCL 33604]|uniref:Uncharacterized protein n=1 Tax=Jaapia argillacea MUCL 33604 TaxID=933084 RepID=A0A067P9U2_9AGAM|nr:hypothetical protein JAAARDRAFT_40925 [Jaapia argillacea MUCL 33604]
MKITDLPSLALAPSLPRHPGNPHPLERQINRESLLDISPDRESLLCSHLSIEEIRHHIKIRHDGQWLYHRTPHTSLKSLSSSLPPSQIGLPSHHQNIDHSHSTTCISSPSSHTIERKHLESPKLPIWYSQEVLEDIPLCLSTPDQMISPRPLHATHILLLLSSSHANNSTLTLSTPQTPVALEIPINDLIFASNTPNLLLSPSNKFPRRSYTDLPRILLPIQSTDLEVFADVVVYMHNKNQAELMRKILPEWIRDVVHPLPSATHVDGGEGGARCVSRKGSGGSLFEELGSSIAHAINFKQLRRTKSLVRSPPSSFSSSSSTSSSSSSYQRTIYTIAHELASASPTTPTLIQSLQKLTSLLDALNEIGLYTPTELWNELDVTWEILVRAVSLCARV